MIMENNLGLTQDRCFPFRFLYRREYYSLPSFLSIFWVMKLIESKQQQLDKKKLDTSLSPSPQNSYGLDDIRKHIGSTHTSANYASQSRAENNTGMKAVAESRFSWWWGKTGFSIWGGK